MRTCSHSPDREANPCSGPAGLAWSRREFLQRIGIAGFGASLMTPFWGPKPRRSLHDPNARLNHACIGVGGMGWVDLQNFLQHKRLQVVALCDVDANNLEKAAKAVPGARLYADWRELLQQEGGRIDSVNVAVPDHMHFAIADSALQKGKHLYCQKPLCHDVAEVRKLTQAAASRGLVTQLGTQMASTLHERVAVQWLREGRIGKITHAYLCSNRPGAVEDYRLKGPRPAVGQQPPASLKWDLWLGTAPVRPYAPGIYHPAKWRAWQDFGTGWSGDIGCHIFDPIWKGLGLTAPLSITAEVQPSWQDSPERRADTWPQGDHITWIFPGNDKIAGRELVLEWFDGEYYPPEHIRKIACSDLKEYPAECSLLVGTEGSMLISLGYPAQLFPEDRFKDVKRPELPPRTHWQHFVDACLGGEKTESHFAQTGPMAEAILLGTVALHVPGEKLVWDPATMRITNNTDASRYLKRTYRKGWKLAGF